MDCISSLRSYVESILTSVSGSKVLLLDDSTAEMIGLVFTQTELLAHDVILIETLQQVIAKKVDTAFASIQCVTLVRPTHDKIRELMNELNSPHFGNYFLFFTNILNENSLRELAMSDHSSKVVAVHEVFIDVFALNKKIYSLNMHRTLSSSSQWQSGDAKMQRMVDGLFSLLCAFKLRCNIRFDARSPICRQLAEKMRSQIDSRMSYVQSSDNALLLLMDRRSDPITPMIHGWSFLELLHDNLGIRNNIIDVRDGAQVKQYVIDERTDQFVEKNIISEYTDITAEIKKLSDSISAQPKPTEIKDIDDLKVYIQNYPSYQEKKNIAAKHLSLMTAATNVMNKNKILSSVGVIEQDIACENDARAQLNSIFEVIDKQTCDSQCIERLALLFAYKNEQSTDLINELKGKLVNIKDGSMIIQHIDTFLQMVGESYYHRDSTIAQRIVNLLSFVTGNATPKLYRYHAPLEETIKSIKEGKLPADMYPCDGNPSDVPQKVIIFYVGGATYSEGKLAYAMSGKGFDVIVGGTTIHNCESFVDEMTN